MGVAHLNFLPGGMTFEEYFRMEGQPESEQAPSALNKALAKALAGIKLDPES